MIGILNTIKTIKKRFIYFAISFATKHPQIIKILLPFRERLMNLLYHGRQKYSFDRLTSQIYSNVDVVLIQAPGWGVNTPPFATASLTAFLRENGFKVMSLDINVELYQANKNKYPEGWRVDVQNFWTNSSMVDRFINDNRDILDHYVGSIIKSNAKIVGFTIYASSYLMSSYLAKKIKEKDGSILIVFGGPEVSRNMSGMEVVSNNKYVDYVVDGEGEVTLLEIVRKVKSGEIIEGNIGTLYRRGDKVVDGGERELIKNLDSLPFPDFSDFDFSMYREPFQVPIASSRGCVNRCIYCDEITFWKRFRSRSGESLFREMKHQLERHPHIFFFEFHDSLVNGNIRELGRLSDAIIESGIRIKWSAQAIIRKEMTYDFFVKLRKSGCVSLTYGMESASPALMVRIGKIFSKNADVEKIIRGSYRAGVCSNLNFMFGLPGETEDEFNETLNFLVRNKKYITTVNPSQSFCVFSRGTKGYSNPMAYGIDFKKGPLYWEYMDGKNDYLMRMERFEKFVAMVHKLGIPSTYPHSKMVNKNENIAEYYFHTEEFEKAIPYYEDSLRYESDNETNRRKLELCHLKTGGISTKVNKQCQKSIY